MILGGYNDKKLGDGYIFRTDDKTVEKAFKTYFVFDTNSNQCAMTREGQITGLVRDKEDRLYTITYNKGDSSLTKINR